MPISQPRMLALIDAALDYQQALDRSVERIIRATERVRIGQQSPTEALDELSLFCTNRSILLSNEFASFTTIAAEHAHFRSNMRRNDSARRWQEAKRRRTGTSGQTRERFARGAEGSQFLSRPPVPVREADSLLPDLGPEAKWLDPEESGAFRPEALVADTFSSGLSNEQKRELDIEIELMNAPLAHQTTRSGADVFSCSCGFEGGFEDWKGHLANGQ